MSNRFFAIVILLLIGSFSPIGVHAQQKIEIAQNSSPTLWDLLFGPTKKQTAPRKTKKPSSSPRPRIINVTAEKIAKSADAKRLMVFGDSLAVDLAKALQRHYAEDPNLIVIGKGVGSSGFVRDDFFDWNAALKQEIEADSFDIAVIFMGINDKQALMVNGKSEKPLSEAWKGAYTQRLENFLNQLTSANKPVIWLGMPPMSAKKFSASIAQISSLQKLATFAAGAEFIDIYERFTDENGQYSSYGPDLNGQNLLMRKSDGIHFSKAGSDKLAFYVSQSLKNIYRSGTINMAIADPLAETDAQSLQRPPLQGLGQLRLLEIAGAPISLNNEPFRSDELLKNIKEQVKLGFDNISIAPKDRADAFFIDAD